MTCHSFKTESRPKLITLCKFVRNKPLAWLIWDEWTSHTAASCQSVPQPAVNQSCSQRQSTERRGEVVRSPASHLGILGSNLGPETGGPVQSSLGCQSQSNTWTEV